MSDIASRLAAALASRYTVERQIGSGGMADVFAAHDIRHDREVAIKVLRPEIAANVGSERFLQEIRIAAKLFHPHILTLLDSGEADGLLYYVMPLVESDSLRNRIDREGQLPIDEAVRIVRECADALNFAHNHGVIHRDIKPENILFEGGHATVTDFGIARALSVAGNERLTNIGMALGTPAYMSPEQAAGEQNVDARSDIYSLGLVLFELLAGRPPFRGSTPPQTIAQQISTAPPAMNAFRKDVPPHVATAISKALEKDPDKRFATAAEFGAALTPEQYVPNRRHELRRLASTAVLFLVIVSVVYLVAARSKAFGMKGTGGLALSLNRKLAQVTSAEGVEQWPAWSPDGTRMLYVEESNARRKLVIRTMASGAERSLTSDGFDYIQPFWSPDGKSVVVVRARNAETRLEPGDVNGAFSENGDIWLVDVATGRARKIIDNAFNPAYSPDGSKLAYDAAPSGPRRIWVSDAVGGNPQQVSSDSSEAVLHAEPRWSPDGKHIVFRRIEKNASDLVALDLSSHKTEWVTHDNVLDMNPVWAPDGHSIYYTSAGGGGLNLWRMPVNADGAPAGVPEQVTTGAGDDINPAISADGSTLAFSVRSVDSDVWRLPVDPPTGRPTGLPQPVSSTTRVESRASWSPDGGAITFNSDRQGEMNIWVRTLATGDERQITAGPGGDYQPNWSPLGYIAFFSARAGNSDIWSVQLNDGKLRQLTTDPHMDTNPFYSPDGKRIAFMSDRRGRLEVWVMNADGSDQRPVGETRAGGHFIRWTADGSSVVFRAESGTQTEIVQVRLSDGAITHLPKVLSGAHMSWSPRHDIIMDVVGHKTVTAYPVDGSSPYKVFAFSEPDIRIDYPVWSPDGKWLLFDRAAPRGGDVWTLK